MIQQLQLKLKNIPVNAPQVHGSMSSGLNKEETLSAQDTQLDCSIPDVDLRLPVGGLKVINQDGSPLMPCKPAKARHLLKEKRAVVVRCHPLVIRLLFDCEGDVQPITLGIDAGYSHIGFSAITKKEELISGEVKLRNDVSKRLIERRMI